MFPFSDTTMKLNQRLISQTGKFAVDELFFEVPKDYSNPDRGTIQLFARSVSRYEKPTTIISEEERRKKSMVSKSYIAWKLSLLIYRSRNLGLCIFKEDQAFNVLLHRTRLSQTPSSRRDIRCFTLIREEPA